MGLLGRASTKPPPTGFAGPPPRKGGRCSTLWAPTEPIPPFGAGGTTRSVVGGELAAHNDTSMDELTKTIASLGDLAHLALFLWASGASGRLVWTLREIARANQRFEDFVKEIAALNRLFQRKD